MTIIFPIVGVRHCLDEHILLDVMSTLPAGVEVILVYDNANPYDRYAIQAWMELIIDGAPARKMQVGYVSSDYTPLIRANFPDSSLLKATVVHPETSEWSESYFEVEMEVEFAIIPSPSARLDLSPIANIPLPAVQTEQRMAWQEIERLHHVVLQHSEDKEVDTALIDTAIDVAKRNLSYLNQGLSGDERHAYVLLSIMLTTMHGYWTDQCDAIWDIRMELDEVHHDTFKSPALRAEVMDKEMATLREQTTTFFEDYARVIKAGITTKEQEIQAHTQWLQALPDNLYAWITDKPTFASKLYYERFRIEDLQAIYMHLLCLEMLKDKKDNIPCQAEEAIAKFSFWTPNASLAKKRAAVLAWRQASMAPTEPIASIAMRTKQLQKQGIVVFKLKPFTQFVEQLNRFLDNPIKENSLRKRMVPPHHDAYYNDGVE